MTRSNAIGAIIALMFPLMIVAEISSGPLGQTFLNSLSLLFLWVACAYWRYGEGIDDRYKRECSQQAAVMVGLMGFALLQPILDTILDAEGGLVLIAYQFAVMALLFRLVPRALSTFSAPWSWRFFLFQTPVQVRNHTRE